MDPIGQLQQADRMISVNCDYYTLKLIKYACHCIYIYMHGPVQIYTI